MFAFVLKSFIIFIKNGPKPASFCLFSFFSGEKFSTNLTINDKSVDGMLGTRTQGSRMVGAEKSTELRRHPRHLKMFSTLTPEQPTLITDVFRMNFSKINSAKVVKRERCSNRRENQSTPMELFS